jgi:hypothetical protein
MVMFTVYRSRRLLEIAEQAGEPDNAPVTELLEKAFDAAIDFMRRNYFRSIETLVNDIKARANNDGISGDTACEEILELIEKAPNFSSELKHLEGWTDGWEFYERELTTRNREMLAWFAKIWKWLEEHKAGRESVDDLEAILSQCKRKETLPNDPDDLRRKGWMVAVHNDYRLADVDCTFWLFTKKIGGRLIALKGEGHSDEIALNLIRAQVQKLERSAPHDEG